MFIFSILGPPTTAGCEAHRKIQKQAAYNSKLKRQQNKQTKHFSIMKKFLSANNPMYVEFKASNQDEEDDEEEE